jgi:hypothetical protein
MSSTTLTQAELQQVVAVQQANQTNPAATWAALASVARMSEAISGADLLNVLTRMSLRSCGLRREDL